MHFRSWLDGLRTQRNSKSTVRRRRRLLRGRPTVEALEDRTLLSTVTAVVLDGDLMVIAEEGEDLVIREDPQNPGQVRLEVDGVLETSIPQTLTASSLTGIEIIAGEGDNRIDLSGLNSTVFSSLTEIIVSAGEGDDEVIASADLDDQIDGGQGSDTLSGGGGNNVIDGGHGDDIISGGDGADDLFGGDGLDEINGGNGGDTISGGDGRDSLFGDAGNDNIVGGHDTDLIHGGDGNDTLNGNSADDTLNGDIGDDFLVGGGGNDSLSGGDGYDNLRGQGGADTLSGGAEPDTLTGGSGSDLLLGEGGNDRLNGEGNADTLAGADGDDSLYGGPGGDLLEGNAGNDQIRGQGGNDTIFGGDGADQMDGGAGNDRIDGDEQWSVSVSDATVNPEGDDDNTASFFATDFEDGVPLEFQQFSSITTLEDVQGFDGLGTDSNVFSGSFLRNSSGGTAGEPGSVPSEPTTLVLTNLPEHTSLDLNFLLAIIENWDGNTALGDAQGNPVDYPDAFNVAVDGELVYSVAFDQQLLADTVNLLDASEYTPADGVQLDYNANDLFTPLGGNHPIYVNDSAWDLSLDSQLDGIAHSASTVTIQWYASGEGYQGGDDESWAIDNVEVLLNGMVDKTDAVFTVTLSRSKDEAVSVNYATEDGIATAVTEDYLPTSGTIVFAPGEVTRTFSVPVIGDTLDEADETFLVNLTGANGAVIIDGQGIGTIVNDDSSFPDIACSVFAPGTPDDYINDVHEAEQEQFATQYAAGYRVAGRWTTTATDGSGLQQGDPTTITWGILPDGTTTDTSATSDLIARLDTIYNESASGPDVTNRTWYTLFVQMFDRWAELSGNTYVFEPADDAAAFPSSQGALGIRPDVRIAGRNIDGNFGILAFNYFPNNGDMVVDSADSFYDGIANNSRGLRNVLGHEHGHGMAFHHVIPVDGSKLMEPSINLGYDGPQYDDILAVQRLYGDAHVDNDTTGTASDLGLIDNSTVTLGADAAGLIDDNGDGTVDVPVAPEQIDFVSIDGTSDTDVFRFTAVSGATANIGLAPVGPTYSEGPQGGTSSSFNGANQSNLILELIDQDGSTVLATSNTGGLGESESIPNQLLATGGVYYVRVTGTQDLIQTYQLDVTVTGGGGGPDPGDPGGGGTLVGDTLLGGAGQDTLVGAGDADLINGGGGNDQLDGRGGDDLLFGGGGDDDLNGAEGDDLLNGQGGIDVLHGGDGNDQLVWRIGDSSDLLDGDADADVVIVQGDSRNNQITVNQSATSQLQVLDGSGTITIQESISQVVLDAGGGRDTIQIDDVDRVSTVMLVVNGQGGRDTITAAGSAMGTVRLLVDGGSGNDTISGGDQDDSLLGGAGVDVIDGGDGDDTILGGEGGDNLEGGDGDDRLFGEAGNDTVSGGDGRDDLDGGDGHDQLTGGTGEDTLSGRAGNDVLNGSDGGDLLRGDAGRDSLFGGGGDDTIDGGTDNDFLVGNAGQDLLRGGHGSDRATGGSGNDSLLGDDGNDTLVGDAGDDILFGSDGSDRLNAGSGSDTVLGGHGKDSLFGGGGSDLVLGGDDDDFINGQGGSDTLAGNAGSDVFGSSGDIVDEAFTEVAFQSLLDQLDAA
ncbi:MAG: Calx-beta domain-containing protein [Planctomycetaceae bacterium]|nr:Calx-beta domain-containing protein [Planctomycetaceae bacterium]